MNHTSWRLRAARADVLADILADIPAESPPERGRTMATWSLAGREVEFGPDVTHVMGVVNLSPESRVRHSVVSSPGDALERARLFREWGATFVDLGAQSSHFENRELGSDEETARLLPALELLVDDGFLVSVDTWKPEVAAAAVAAGCAIVNDTGGLSDPVMCDLIASAGVAAVAMHIEGRNPLEVGSVVLSDHKAAELVEAYRPRLAVLAAAGIDRVLFDPGLSINYRSDYAAYSRQQMQVIRDIPVLRELGAPVLIPVPRKAETHRMVAYLTLALEHGADVVRVHDVDIACDLVAAFGRATGP
ncbi:MAG: dihydropteroate synthase [Acidimicrobiia bacterium]|nr:dihydropteroate synthase [Acidimicrobiia bacterium]